MKWANGNGVVGINVKLAMIFWANTADDLIIYFGLV